MMPVFRMVYLTPTAPNRPHGLPIAAPSAREATQIAETVARIAGWVLLTVTNERRG